MKIEKFDNRSLIQDLKKNYHEATKDPQFIKLINKLKIKEEFAMKHTSKLQRSVCELNNCKNCPGLDKCKNPSKGYIYYPRLNGNILVFDSIACKYKQEEISIDENSSKMYNQPLAVRTANMKDIDKKDKNRVEAIKWIVNFYKEYKNNKHIKGLFLHGSFGCGKTYLIAALFNELAKEGYEPIIYHYPRLLVDLKESFGSSFDKKMNELMECDLLLLDDIGAESVTSWSRDEILSTILQYRMDEKLPTFITSNLNIEELENHLAETKDSVDKVKSKRIIERVKQLTDDIEIISVNRRH